MGKSIITAAVGSFWNWVLGGLFMIGSIVGWIWPDLQPVMNGPRIHEILPPWALFAIGAIIWIIGFVWNLKQELSKKNTYSDERQELWRETKEKARQFNPYGVDEIKHVVIPRTETSFTARDISAPVNSGNGTQIVDQSQHFHSNKPPLPYSQMAAYKSAYPHENPLHQKRVELAVEIGIEIQNFLKVLNEAGATSYAPVRTSQFREAKIVWDSFYSQRMPQANMVFSGFEMKEMFDTLNNNMRLYQDNLNHLDYLESERQSWGHGNEPVPPEVTLDIERYWNELYSENKLHDQIISLVYQLLGKLKGITDG